MDLRACESSESRFETYVEGLMSVIGHADRAKPLRDYCLGLAMPGERKSVEPLAAVTAPARVAAQHQSLLHFVANAPGSDEAGAGTVGPPGGRGKRCGGGSWWWTGVTAKTPGCGTRSARLICAIAPASSRAPRCGRPACSRCRRRGRGSVVERGTDVARQDTSRSRSRRWPS